ncbi:MAG: formylglycine-generating enzyme family protein [Candidatus Adiutrix sp.]|jgi:formylglycine-generating enzyme required for sulfatase activity|nr:formylglycine-generating enzyme family protein [Candidatus Adiutrix sp.]
MWSKLFLRLSRLAALLMPGGAATGLAEETTNSIGMEFVLIPAGEFLMGSPDSDEEVDDDEKPRHKVIISRPFYLGKYAVTQSQWEAVMGNNPSKFKGWSNPVEMVSWDDAQAFIKKLNQKEGGKKYRLPTEAEWEYAARAGTTGRYSFGDDAGALGRYAWYKDNSGGLTHPVGQKEPNGWGLYDMHGNVWEWARDRHGVKYYAGSPGTDPRGPFLGSYRVNRGGGWNNSARLCRSAIRNNGTPGYRRQTLGFRLAFSPGRPAGGIDEASGRERPGVERDEAKPASGGTTYSSADSGAAKATEAGPGADAGQYKPGEWSFVTVGEKYIYSEGSGTMALVTVLEDKSDAEYEAFRLQIAESYEGNFSEIFDVSLRRDVNFTWVGKMKFTKIYAYIKNSPELNYNDEQMKFINSCNIALAILKISPYQAIARIDKIMDEQISVMNEVQEKYEKSEDYKKEFDDLLEKMSSQYAGRDYHFASILLHWLPEHEERFSDPKKALAFLIILQRIMEKQ